MLMLKKPINPNFEPLRRRENLRRNSESDAKNLFKKTRLVQNVTISLKKSTAVIFSISLEGCTGVAVSIYFRAVTDYASWP
jgi:hypothetical protein